MNVARWLRLSRSYGMALRPRVVHKRLLATAASGPSEVEDYDIVIVGGGPAGLALACALSSNTSGPRPSIALVEASDLSKVREWKPESEGDGTWFSNRVSSITNSSRQFLQDIGAWQHVDESRTCPIEEMQVWDGLSDARIQFLGSDAIQAPHTPLAMGQYAPEMARLTENLNLQRALLRRLQSQDVHVTFLDKTRVASIVSEQPLGSSSSPWPVVQTNTNRCLRARLLVGADGPSSPVRAFSKIETFGWNYDARAIVATLQHSASGITSLGLPRPCTAAYQRFLPTGPLAFLPLAPGRASLVWSTTPELAEALLGAGPDILSIMINAAFRLPDVSITYLHELLLERWADVREGKEGESQITAGEFVDAVQWRESSHSIEQRSALSSFEDSQGGVPSVDIELFPPLIQSVQPNSAASFPLRVSHAESYVGSRTALLGDAAHTVHPLAGQGLNLGLADAASLSRCIMDAINYGADVGSRTTLADYPRKRYFENHMVISATDKLQKLYGTRLGPIVWARSVGLEVVNEWAGLKGGLMRAAGGSAESGGTHGGDGGLGWMAAAGGVEAISAVLGTGRTLAGVVGDLISGKDGGRVASRH